MNRRTRYVQALPWGRASRFVPGALTALVLLLAVVLYTRFGFQGGLGRDEAILAYGAQGWARGLPFYTSIFDAKGPLASALGGLAAWVGPHVGLNDLTAIRGLFLALACGAAVGIYVLAVRVWESQVAGIAAAVTFLSFRGFATDAAGGPDAKTPGVCFGVAAMVLLLGRRWYWGAVLAGMATLCWQPFGFYPILAVVAAAVCTEAGRRVRSGLIAIAGALTPVIVTCGVYLLAGSVGDLVDGMIVFPLTGVERLPESLKHRLEVITGTVSRYYGDTRGLLWAGLALLPLLLIWSLLRRRLSVSDPRVVVVFASGLAAALYTASDFQGYPDVFPLLPYAALGIGGAVGFVVKALPGRARYLATAVALVAAAVLVSSTWQAYTLADQSDRNLPAQQATAKHLSRLAGPKGIIWVLGNPDVLVVTHRHNPSRYIYLNSGFDAWVGEHTPGGLPGFADQILRACPSVVVEDQWKSHRRVIVLGRLATVYTPRVDQHRLVFLPPGVIRDARHRGVQIPRPYPLPPRYYLQGPGPRAHAPKSCPRLIAQHGLSTDIGHHSP